MKDVETQEQDDTLAPVSRRNLLLGGTSLAITALAVSSAIDQLAGNATHRRFAEPDRGSKIGPT